MSVALLEVEGLSKRFQGIVASDDIQFAVAEGELHAVIGPNGAGKTTLIGQLAGELRPDSGWIRFAGRDVTALPVHRRSLLGLARSFQVTSILPGFSVRENVALAVQARSGTSFRFFGRADAEAELNGPALAALEEVGLAARAEIPARESELHVPRARFHAELAREFVDPETVEPIYLRLPDAEQAR